jgi:hypothetical protein
MMRPRWMIGLLGATGVALLAPSFASAAPSASSVTVGVAGTASPTATVTGGPITGQGDDVMGHPLSPCPPMACESFAVTLLAPSGFTVANQISLSVSVSYTGAPQGTLDTYIENSGGFVVGADPNSDNPSNAADGDAAPGNYTVIIAGSTGANDTYTATITASSVVRIPVVLPSSSPITFSVPTVVDPIHTYGEPSVGVDAKSNVFASGPAGTGTQRSFWEASVDGGNTFRTIHQTDYVVGTSDAPGGGDTDIAFDHHTPQGQYFSDLYALACLRVATTHDEGNTTSEATYPGGCAGNPPEVDRQWFAVWDPVGITTNTLTPAHSLSFTTNTARPHRTGREATMGSRTAMRAPAPTSALTATPQSIR